MDTLPLFANNPIFQWDVLAVVILATCVMIAISIQMLVHHCKTPHLLLAWIPFVLILVLTLMRLPADEQKYRDVWKKTLLGMTQSFASATESMGHWQIDRNTKPDDPIYRDILNLHADWCREIPIVAYVYTLRLDDQKPNTVTWIISCPSDINKDGVIEGSDEEGEPLYESYTEWHSIYRRGFDGGIEMQDGVYSQQFHGEFITAVAPLRNPQGEIEGILGVDFFPDTWRHLAGQMRLSSLQMMVLILAFYLGVLIVILMLRRTIFKVTEANLELISAKKAADAAARAKSDFLANLSHEIRTPMNALVGFTEIMTQRILQNCGPQEREDAEGILEIIRKSSQDLLTIINDILDFSKIEANLLQVESGPLSIKQVIEDIWQMEMSNVVAKHLDFSVKYKEPIPDLILGDPVRLRQILVNLIGNAIKFTEKGSIVVQCETFTPPSGEAAYSRSGAAQGAVSGDDSSVLQDPQNPYPGSTMLRIDIIDTGIGISKDQMEHLFQPFTQVDTSTTREHGGTGLGLSIARRLALLMDGEIIVNSEPGVGSTFSLILHVYLPSPGETESGIERRIEKNQIGSTLEAGLEIRPPMPDTLEENESGCGDERPLQNARILLVEDMAVNQLVISTQLRDAGAMVEIVGNGKLGVAKVTQDMDNGLFFDVILMDMQMPVMDGYEATTILRSQGYHRPIIAITAHALTGDREKTIEIGCNDYIAKPVDRKNLIETIRKYLK